MILKKCLFVSYVVFGLNCMKSVITSVVFFISSVEGDLGARESPCISVLFLKSAPRVAIYTAPMSVWLTAAFLFLSIWTNVHCLFAPLIPGGVQCCDVLQMAC
jgi:hypothetical protein